MKLKIINGQYQPGQHGEFMILLAKHMQTNLESSPFSELTRTSRF
jgi:hypothetical protein